MSIQRSYIYGGDTGETPESIARKRAIAEALISRSGVPRNIGEGLAAIGDALGYRSMMGKADKAQAAGMATAAADFSGAFPDSNGEASGAPMNIGGDQESFIQSLAPAAMEASQRTGIDPRIIIAQAAQESGWGRSAPGNNFFGIKSHGAPGGQTLGTHEVVNGQSVPMTDSFRTYGSPDDSVSGYADFITSNPRYKPLMQAQGMEDQIQALGQSGYATDPNYASSVGRIARAIQLPPGGQGATDAGQAIARALAGQGGTQVASLDQSVGAPPLAQAQPPVAQPPTQMAQAGPSLQQLMKAASNPWLTDGQKSVVNSLIQQQMQQNDPMRQLQMQEEQLKLRDLQNPQPDFQAMDGALLRIDPRTGEVSTAYQSPPKPADPFTLGDGQTRYGPDGKVIASQPKGPDYPTGVQEYLFYADQEKASGRQPLSFNDWELQSKKAGATTVNVGPNGEQFGNPGDGLAWVRNPDGTVKTDERGLPIAGAFQGGKAFMSAQDDAAKAGAAKQMTDIGANVVTQDVDRALDAIAKHPNLTTGLGGALTQGLPGTPSYDVGALVTTIKANAAFDKLQAMRAASPTGGALGNVSDTEGRLLASAIGNLEQAQGTQQVTDNLKRVKNIYLDTIYGTAEKRADLMKQGALSPEQNQQIDAQYMKPSFEGGYREGQTATGPNGEKVRFTNGKWMPIQ